MRTFLLIAALCVAAGSSASAARTTIDAAGHPIAAYSGSFRGLARGQPESMNIVVQYSRLYIATHGWWESCWIAKPGEKGMVIVQGGPKSTWRAWAVDTYWVLSLEPGGLRIEDD